MAQLMHAIKQKKHSGGGLNEIVLFLMNKFLIIIVKKIFIWCVYNIIKS